VSDSYVPDLEGYFARIGYEGPRSATLDVLNAVTAHHTSAIPFENFSVLSGEGVSLEPEAVEEKLVRQGRGGYCFEQNLLLLGVLRALGFEVKTLSGRVRWGRTRDVMPPRTHFFLQVTLDEAVWITDCGMGSNSLTRALRWEDGLVQETGQDERRFINEDGRWFQQVRFSSEWLDVCEFTGEEMPLIDREVGNWWTSTSPESHFRFHLMIARCSLDGTRLAVSDNEFIKRPPRGAAEKREIESLEELVEILDREFELTLPDGCQLDQLGLTSNAAPS